MAEIKNYKDHSTIQIRKDIYFVFGNLEYDCDDMEKIKKAIDSFRKYFKVIEEEPPEINMNWRTAQEGEWTLSDDFRVIQILKRTENKNKSAYNKAIIRSCVGTFAVNAETYFDTDFEMHEDRYRISNANKQQYQRLIERKKATNDEIIFAKRVAHGDRPKDAYMKTFSTKDGRYATDMSRILVKQERVKNNISSEVESLLEEEGVSKRYIIRQYKQLIDDGLMQLKDCSGSVRAALKDLADMSAMMPDKTKQSASNGVFEEIPDDKLLEMQEAEQKVLEEPEEFEDFEQEFEPSNNVEVEAQIKNNTLKQAGLDLLQ